MAAFFKRPQQAAGDPAAGQPGVTQFGRIPRAATAQPAAASAGAAATASASPVAAPARASSGGQRYGYSWKIWLPLRASGYLFVALALLVADQTFFAILVSGGFGKEQLAQAIGAAVGLLCSIFIAMLVGNALPAFEVRADGLVVNTLLRRRVLPWSRVGRLYSMDVGGERYLVYLSYGGRPLTPTHRIYALLAGVGGSAGLFYTSDIAGFEDLTRQILAARMRAVPDVSVDELLDETANMPLFNMLLTPERAMNRLAGVAEDDGEGPLLEASNMHRMARTRAIVTQVALAALPVLLFVVDRLVRGYVPPLTDGFTPLWTAVGLLVLGMGELFIVALALQAIGENFVGRGEFNLPLAVYPFIELVRVLAFILAFALVAVKAPFALPLICWALGAALVASLTALFTQRLYGVDRNHALLGGAASALIQCLVIALYMISRG